MTCNMMYVVDCNTISGPMFTLSIPRPFSCPFCCILI